MNVGTVIKEKDGMYVVTRTENNRVSEVESLEKYVAKSVSLQLINGEHKTIDTILMEECDKYLNYAKIVDAE